MNAHQNRIARRGKIVALHEAGFTPTQIGLMVGVDRKTVYKWIRREDETGNLADLRKKLIHNTYTSQSQCDLHIIVCCQLW